MDAPTKEDFDRTEEEIIEACGRPGFNGYTAEACGKCRKKANVLNGGHGWFCTCGHFNMQSFHGANIPHKDPDLGPSHDFLLAAYAKAKKQGKTCY